MQRVDEILHFWFGHIEETFVPTQHLSQMWFSATPEIDQEIRSNFGSDLEKAILGEYDDWGDNPRSCLALIIIFDQFSRHIYRDTPMSFAQDDKALDLCVRGIERQFDHKVSLIERAFFYMPLMHSENFDMQHTSVRAFKMLADLSFPEARTIFENFFDYSIRHYQVVERFKRFPHRNLILARKNTPEEDEFLSIEGGGFKK